MSTKLPNPYANRDIKDGEGRTSIAHDNPKPNMHIQALAEVPCKGKCDFSSLDSLQTEAKQHTKGRFFKPLYTHAYPHNIHINFTKHSIRNNRDQAEPFTSNNRAKDHTTTTIRLT